VRERVGVGPAHQVEADAGGKELEALVREFLPSFPGQHAVEDAAEPVQMEHVGRGVALLLDGERLPAPVGLLLLLRDVDAEQLLAQILEAVAVGVRPREPGRDLGAVVRVGPDAEVKLQGGHVRPGEVVQLQRVPVLEHGLEARRFVGAPPEPDQVRGAVTRGDLHEAKAVSGDRQSHRFGVDRRAVGKRQTGGEIAFVEVDVHGVRIPLASGSAV